MLNILRYFPTNIYNLIKAEIDKENKIIDELQEIRIRAKRPVLLKLRNREIVIKYNSTQNELLQIVEKLCDNSIYAYKNQICEGFITVRGGHRVGLTGSVVIENNKIINIKYISSLNFRIAREVLNCSEEYLGQVINVREKYN